MLSCTTDYVSNISKNPFITLFLLLLLLTLKETPSRAWVRHRQSAAAEVHIKKYTVVLNVALPAKTGHGSICNKFRRQTS